MESWIKRIFLTPAAAGGFLALVSGSLLAAEGERPLIEPDVQPSKVDEALIDTEDFEIGVFGGFMAIEDFESSAAYGARIAYHISEAFFVEANLGFAEGGETSFEKLAGNVELLSDEEREYVWYNLNLGYNVLPGEAFLTSNYAFNTNFYLVAGAGATDFAGDNRFTVNFGAGYQVLLTDSVSVHLSVREHLYDIDVTGEEKTAFNTEMSAGLSVFF